MRKIAVKYEGECKKCGEVLEVGTVAMYEKSMGCFCVGCEPKDVEEIRARRLEKAERKADRYDAWAAKRESKANAALNSYPEIRHDYAFITQPGRIPFRDRMNRADDRAMESLNVAEGMRSKAENLRHVTVKGDAERNRQARRDELDSILSKGSRVKDFVFGEGEIIQVFKKSYRVQFDRLDRVIAREKSYVMPVKTV